MEISKLAIVGSMGLVMAAHQGADAGVTRWSMPAAACTLETGSAPLAFVSAASGDIGFNTGQTGTIRIICPVSGIFAGTGGTPETLGVVFYDTDGTTDNCSVHAFLNRTNASAVEGGGTVISYSSTNDGVDGPSNAPPFRNRKTVVGNHTLDFDASFYWIEVILHRNTPTCGVAIEGVQINGTFNP